MPEPLTSPCQSATRRWGSTEACPAPLPRPSSGPTPGASSTASPGPNSHPCEVVVQGPWGKRADAEALPETRHAHAHTRAHTFKRHSSHAHVLSNVHACMHQHRALTDLCVFMGSSAGIHMDKLTCVYCQNALCKMNTQYMCFHTKGQYVHTHACTHHHSTLWHLQGTQMQFTHTLMFRVWHFKEGCRDRAHTCAPEQKHVLMGSGRQAHVTHMCTEMSKPVPPGRTEHNSRAVHSPEPPTGTSPLICST